MNLSIHIGPLLALIAGILILVVPRLLNYIVALYLIIIGVTGLFGVGAIDNNYNTPIDSSTDRFKIQSLTVDYTPGPQGNGDPIPAPATLSLFAAALLGLRSLARRRKG